MEVLVVYNVLVAYFHELEYQQGCWVLGSHLAQCWRHYLIYRVSRGGDNTFESVPSIPYIFMSCGQHL